MNAQSFSLTARAASFRNAFSRPGHALRTQPNIRIHAVATAVYFSGDGMPVYRADWLWVVAAICAVWVAESFNTAIEFLADAVSLEHHPLIGKAKDAAAAAVLVTAIGAAVIGVLVFGPILRSRLF